MFFLRENAMRVISDVRILYEIPDTKDEGEMIVEAHKWLLEHIKGRIDFEHVETCKEKERPLQ